MKMWIVDLFFIASGGHRRLMQNDLLGEYVGVTAFDFCISSVKQEFEEYDDVYCLHLIKT